MTNWKKHYLAILTTLEAASGQSSCRLNLLCLFGWLVSFLTSSSTTRLYRGRAPRQSILQFYVLPHMRQSWETMTSVSAGHIILTPTQPVGSGRPQRESNPVPPHQESRALPTELRRPRLNLPLTRTLTLFWTGSKDILTNGQGSLKIMISKVCLSKS